MNPGLNGMAQSAASFFLQFENKEDISNSVNSEILECLN